MAAEVNAIYDVCAKISVRALRDGENAVRRAQFVGKILEFFTFSAGSEAEMPEKGEIRVFADDGNSDIVRVLQHIGGVIVFADGNCDRVRCGSDLHNGVDDARVILFVASDAENE